MRKTHPQLSICLLTVLLGSGLASATQLSEIVPADAKVRTIASGFKFLEGPAWSPHGFLLFSDIPANRILELKPDGSTTDFLNPSENSNGLVFDQKGTLFACQGGANRIGRIDIGQNKKVTSLTGLFEGKKLNMPNDLALDAHGGLYFTDPNYGSGPPQQPVMGVYYLDASGRLSRVIDDLQRPNGILVSPSGKHLYVANPDLRELWQYDIDSPGKLSGKKLFFTGDLSLDVGGPDGMAHDAQGNIYATYKSIVVLDPAGLLIGRIEVPSHPSNCTFGGKDLKTLFITSGANLYAIDLKIPGQPPQPAGPSPSASPTATSPPAATAKTREAKLGALTLKVPETWKESPGDGGMRAGQFELPAVEGDREAAELIVYYFGPGGAGGVAANLKRWIGQFASEGRNVKLTQGKQPGGKIYTLADVTGTYNKSVGPPVAQKTKPMPGARMIAAIIETSGGPYFLKLTGPEKTVTASTGPIRASFGGDAGAETEYKLPE